MAKHNEYPQNKSIRARLDCLITSHSTMRGVLRSMRDFATDGQLPPRVIAIIDEALTGAELAGEAISGMEDSP